MVPGRRWGSHFFDFHVSILSLALLFVLIPPPLRVPIRDVHEYMVGDSVPGIVDADEKQKQGRASNAKQGAARAGEGCECRQCEHCVRSPRQHDVTQPILKYWLVGSLLSHTPDHDQLVHDSGEAQKTPKNCGDGNGWPRSMQKRRQKQNDAEVNDRGTSECGASLSRTCDGPVGDQRKNNKLQSDQGARSRSDDYVEVVPFGEF